MLREWRAKSPLYIAIGSPLGLAMVGGYCSHAPSSILSLHQLPRLPHGTPQENCGVKTERKVSIIPWEVGEGAGYAKSRQAELALSHANFVGRAAQARQALERAVHWMADRDCALGVQQWVSWQHWLHSLISRGHSRLLFRYWDHRCIVYTDRQERVEVSIAGLGTLVIEPLILLQHHDGNIPRSKSRLNKHGRTRKMIPGLLYLLHRHEPLAQSSGDVYRSPRSQ